MIKRTFVAIGAALALSLTGALGASAASAEARPDFSHHDDDGLIGDIVVVAPIDIDLRDVLVALLSNVDD